jgi:hypothetical protein
LGQYFWALLYLLIFCFIGFTAVTFVTGTLAWWAPTAVNYAYQWQKDSRSTTTLAPSTVMTIVTTNSTISTCENGSDVPKDPSYVEKVEKTKKDFLALISFLVQLHA